MKRVILPRPLLKLVTMSRRQFLYELKANLWFSSIIYGILALTVVFISYLLDFTIRIEQYVPELFISSYELTHILVSTLIGGILTLNAFTFNSILVVLTSFSGQFSPRMLLSFISDRKTQHVLGIFNSCLLYVLISFFLINEERSSVYAAIPTFTVLFAVLTLANFVFFINHAVKWMQVPNLTQNMKIESKRTILQTLLKDLEPYRTKDPAFTMKHLPEEEAHVITSAETGFIQIFDYKRLIKEAKKDEIVIRLEKRIGDFVTEGLPLLSYWKENNHSFNEEKYRKLIYLGPKKTEVQDLEFGVNKLTEIAMKAIGNDDPNTANNAIYQLTDLLVSISKVTRFSPYLTGHDNQLRVIIKDESFDYYLYAAFSQISVAAKNDPFLTANILEALTILSKSISSENHYCCWQFASSVARGYQSGFSYSYNEQRFFGSLKGIAETTGNKDAYAELEKELRERLRQSSLVEEQNIQ
ncbi:DUF2254 domain-containing protein [Salibacterium aidingense]|uniref:DUF2254 domain-containing protein n=1 Tax=Salibacterium aidingense TaxID=384933 RepID=UPI001E5533D2|nr:DUF2254 domain-containing protein [Salibacterium aidingense]